VFKGRGKKMNSKIFYHHETKIVIHSPLMGMNKEERREWFDREWENGNPVLREFVDLLWECVEKYEEGIS
jgi:hypothetical protein